MHGIPFRGHGGDASLLQASTLFQGLGFKYSLCSIVHELSGSLHLPYVSIL